MFTWINLSLTSSVFLIVLSESRVPKAIMQSQFSKAYFDLKNDFHFHQLTP